MHAYQVPFKDYCYYLLGLGLLAFSVIHTVNSLYTKRTTGINELLALSPDL